MPPKTYPAVARVVQLADYQQRRLLLEDFTLERSNQHAQQSEAIVVSLVDRVTSYASVEVDELSALTPAEQKKAVLDLLKEHLAMEFGQLRIAQNDRTFVVQHRNVDELIGALLRVQYHLYQCSENDLEAVGVPRSFVAMNLTWGVGASVTDATEERLRRRRGKRFQSED